MQISLVLTYLLLLLAIPCQSFWHLCPREECRDKERCQFPVQTAVKNQIGGFVVHLWDYLRQAWTMIKFIILWLHWINCKITRKPVPSLWTQPLSSNTSLMTKVRPASLPGACCLQGAGGCLLPCLSRVYSCRLISAISSSSSAMAHFSMSSFVLPPNSDWMVWLLKRKIRILGLYWNFKFLNSPPSCL